MGPWAVGCARVCARTRAQESARVRKNARECARARARVCKSACECARMRRRAQRKGSEDHTRTLRLDDVTLKKVTSDGCRGRMQRMRGERSPEEMSAVRAIVVGGRSGEAQKMTLDGDGPRYLGLSNKTRPQSMPGTPGPQTSITPRLSWHAGLE